MAKYRWGIVGTGGIATAMAKTLRDMPDAEVVAVASPTPGRAEAFAAEFDIPQATISVEQLVGLDIDVAYIGSSNHRHPADVATLLTAGIPVLCEKPLATTAFEAEKMMDLARQHGVFLMEAMWMRFLPFWDRMTSLIDGGAVGPIRMIRADFGIAANPDPRRRWFNPLHGGGSLLDVGIYPVSFAVALAGEPRLVEAAGTKTETGVDAQVGMIFRHDHDVLSILDCSFVADTPLTAAVSGPVGRITLERPFHHTGQLTLARSDDRIETFPVAFDGSGYRFEVEEVHRCLASHRIESPMRPLADTLGVIRVLDRVRSTAFG